jgi:methyl-accepting chemotaxis protein
MDQEPVHGGSVSGTFRGALLLIYLVSVLAVIPIIYFLTKDELYTQANKELKLLVDVVSSARAIVKDKTRPYFLAKGEFFSPVVSSTVMAKELASQFHKLQPTYLIRMVSDNPLNSENMPEGLEVGVLDTLRKSDNDKGLIQSGTIQGRNYLISAVPTKVHDDCLMCHGDPSAAPKEVTAKYGTTSGFGWKPGEVIGATLVGVPVADLNSAVLKRSGIVVGIITVLFAGVLIVLNRLVQNNIIQPILRITVAAKAISLGRSNEPLVSDRDDEIGALTRAFELMRRSINIATDQIVRLNKARKT